MPYFLAIGQTVAEIWWFFDFSKMMDVRHLGFVMRVFGPPRMAFGCLYHCAKFSWNPYSNFDNMQVLTFCELGLKTPIHAPKSGFWETWPPKWRAVSSWPPERHLNRSPVRAVHELKNIIKKKKGIRNWNMWQITCSPKPPTLSQRHADFHA